MSDDPRDVLAVLRYELNFLDQGGYHAQKNALVPVSPFQDSLSCINYGLPRRPHTCRKCLLWDCTRSLSARGCALPLHTVDADGNDH
jgi:hypothetical protein